MYDISNMLHIFHFVCTVILSSQYNCSLNNCSIQHSFPAQLKQVFSYATGQIVDRVDGELFLYQCKHIYELTFRAKTQHDIVKKLKARWLFFFLFLQTLLQEIRFFC